MGSGPALPCLVALRPPDFVCYSPCGVILDNISPAHELPSSPLGPERRQYLYLIHSVQGHPVFTRLAL